MPTDLSNYLVIGISSRALFDLSAEDQIYQTQGLETYERYQLDNEHVCLKPGAGFPLVKSILRMNGLMPGKRKTEVVIMSRNSAETSLRIFNSIEQHNLDITRAALTGGAPLAPYLKAFSVDLFLSLYEDDVQAAVDAGVAAALLYAKPENPTQDEIGQIRIAFDGDAVLFSEEAEHVYQTEGLDAFVEHEKRNARRPLPEGPFAKLLKTLSHLQSEYKGSEKPIRTALVTARNSPAHERVIRTLRAWGVDLDETFFLGGMDKSEVLKAFRPHIYFDDQRVHCDRASKLVPTGRVPWVRRTTS
ncbi:MAG TPA: 5'-nucleotidase [Steroidobacteraceae bacterium]|nr:5'-nucleotidase [Steroidobacteraceae bacterium]